MKRLLVLVCLLTCIMSSHAQTPEDLIRDVHLHSASLSELKAVINKNAANLNTSPDFWYFKLDTTTFLNLSVLQDCFSYKVLQGAHQDTLEKWFRLRAVYKNDQVVYLWLDDDPYLTFWSTKTPVYKFVDTAYNTALLGTYNKVHQTDFTWRDLYEDTLNEYQIIPGLQVPRLEDTNEDGDIINGDYTTTWQMELFLPLIKNRDHKSILRNCRSFNPTRQAFGAACLYALQKKGEPLSKEEKQLLKTIRRSSETSTYRSGCVGHPHTKLSEILTKKELETFSGMTGE